MPVKLSSNQLAEAVCASILDTEPLAGCVTCVVIRAAKRVPLHEHMTVLMGQPLRAQCMHKVAVSLAYGNLALTTTVGVRACAVQRYPTAVFRDAARLQVNRFFAA